MSYIPEIQDAIPRVKNYFCKDQLQKKVNFVLQSWSNPASRKLMRRSPKFRWIQCPIRKKLFLLGRGSGMTLLLANLSKETLFQPSLKIGHEICTSLWSRWTRKWRRCSLEFYGSKTAASVSEVWRAKILGHGLAPTHLWRKQQNEVPVLHKFQKFFIENSCHSMTHKWEFDSVWVDGSRRYSIHMERFPVSSRMLLKCHFNPQIRTHRFRTRKPGRKTDHLLHTSQPIRGQSRRRSTWRWPLEVEKSTLPQQVEIYSGRCLGQFSPGTGQRISILADKVSCRSCIQLCAGRLCLQCNFSNKENELHLRDSRRLVPHRRLYLRVLGNRSSGRSSIKTPLRVRLPAPGNWCRMWKESRERIKATRQMTQSHPASGNWSGKNKVTQLITRSWSGVLSHLLRKKSLNVKSTSELKELHEM